MGSDIFILGGDCGDGQPMWTTNIRETAAAGGGGGDE